MLTHAVFSLSCFLQNESKSCQIRGFHPGLDVSHANQKGGLGTVDTVTRELISPLNNLNTVIQIILQSQKEIKHSYFLKAGKFILRDYLEKNAAMDKEKKKSVQH